MPPNDAVDIAAVSDRLADAVAAAAAYTVRIRARRGLAASGIALAGDLILTADHVIDPRRESEIMVGLPDGAEVSATLAGRDPATDLAVLRLAESRLQPASAAEGAARTGSLALVVARPGSEPSASLAFITGTGGPARTRGGGVLERFYLVDTVMYPGFSGGPLVNVTGAVLGLATSGLGFGGPSVAVPWDLASQVADTLAKQGRVTRGYLGIGSQPISLSPTVRETVGGQARGLLVVHVAEDGPAAAAGVLQGDILVKLDGTPIENADDLQAMLGPNRVGAALTASLVRGGEVRDLQLTVGARE